MGILVGTTVATWSLQLFTEDVSWRRDCPRKERRRFVWIVKDQENLQWLAELPEGSVRGGVLTQGTVLAVTSNPDRTSPVKRGLFILENLLGMPPPAPPPNIPALEDVESDPDKQLSLRETLAVHRQNALCSSCHIAVDTMAIGRASCPLLPASNNASFRRNLTAVVRTFSTHVTDDVC